MNKQPQILVVDDEPTARDTLEAFLHPENYHLIFATSGFEALDYLQNIEPDVILLDVMMPGLSGYEVCQRIKAHEDWRHIPLILVTALNSKAEVIRGLDAGADEFLSKPVNGFELRARVRSMLRIKHQYDQLAATLKLREDLATMIVHDMRAPLTLILALNELLLEEAAVVPVHLVQHISQSYQQAKRLQAFVNDLLTTAKVENDHLILKCSMVDVNQLLLELQQSYQVIAQSKGINFVLETSFIGQRPVGLDYNLFYRLLDNLLLNAFKFSQTGSTITVRVEYLDPPNSLQTPANTIRIKVIDEGLGIPIEYRERIFDKFEIIAAERNISQVGLGLAFCKLVVEAHGGRIWVEVNEPHGSIFVVEI